MKLKHKEQKFNNQKNKLKHLFKIKQTKVRKFPKKKKKLNFM